MDVIGPDVLIPVAAAAVVGLLVGMAVARAGGRRSRRHVEELEVRVAEREGRIGQLEARARELEARLGAAEQERDATVEQLSSYQAQVVDHFSQTSELLKQLTLQYRGIYQHLAQGAETLCPEGAPRLETNAEIEGLAAGLEDEPLGPHLEEELEEERALEREREGDDDGVSVEEAHHESPLQVDPRPEI